MMVEARAVCSVLSTAASKDYWTDQLTVGSTVLTTVANLAPKRADLMAGHWAETSVDSWVSDWAGLSAAMRACWRAALTADRWAVL
jgi:hypothetical protein